MSDAFTMYALDHIRTPKTIRKRLTERRAELADMLVGGYASDWADYRHRVGVIIGLNEAIDVCAEIEKQQEN